MGKNYDLTVNVMMVGGRRCGKTSVLAAMQSCFEKEFGNTPLLIGPADYDMMDVIEQKYQEMTRYFLERGNSKTFVPDSNPSEDLVTYPFYVKLQNKESEIRVNFIDYPGEFLKDNSHLAELENHMKESRILLIAIDTPHMMEQKGLYNDPRHLCFRVTEMIKRVNFADAKKGPGMVLFVPMKCERYYNRNQMEEVRLKVQESYQNLLQYLCPKAEQGSKITIAIAPILTMGGAEFDRFQRGASGEIEIDQVWKTPRRALYRFPDMSKNAPEPVYCEQPLLYVLSYLLSQAKLEKEKSKYGNVIFDFVMNLVQTSILNWSSAGDYLEQSKAINGKLKREGDGYFLLNRGSLRL